MVWTTNEMSILKCHGFEIAPNSLAIGLQLSPKSTQKFTKV